MRLQDFPSTLKKALSDATLSVFAGAGVSMGEPACLPNFKTLTKELAQGTGEDLGDAEPEDRFLGRLNTDKRVQVHERAAELLTGRCPRPTALHRDLLRLFPGGRSTRIVTTNFDLLFEQAAAEGDAGSNAEVFKAPALPLGRDFSGIVHVHGAVDRPETMVLTDKDFGGAYLTDGWARRFLVDLFRSWTVLFVGYSHGDTVMNYLARALPAGGVERFALTDEAEDGRWSRLGITPIPFRKSDYSDLYAGIRLLAEYRSRGILGWQHQIKEIAKNNPPIDDEAEEALDEAFSDPARTRFFTASAKDPAWIGWLDRRERLINLFQGRAELTEPERVLAKWLAKGFACDHPDEMWRVIGRHAMQVHPEFWQELAYAVGLPGSNIPDRETPSRWVSVLLATAPAPAPDHTLQFLADRCIERQAIDSLIAVFEHVTTTKLSFSRFSTGLYGESSRETVPPILAELDAESDDYRYTAAHIWEKGLRPNLAVIAKRMITCVVANLEAQHRTLSTWGAVYDNWDPLSSDRFGIEPLNRATHTQLPEISDVLIDGARDCLEWLVENEPLEVAQWCDRLAAAPAPILRRLAIHGVIARELDPNETIDWMLQHSSQYDELTRHERIRALKKSYPRADMGRRRAVIKDILDYRWPRTQDDDSEELSVSHRFSWLEWLLKAAPDCSLLREALQNLRQQYPDFRLRTFPDVDPRTWLDGEMPVFPWKPAKLLAHPASFWTDKLLVYQPSDPLQPDRRRLLDAVTRASSQNFYWGIELSEDLIGKDEWEADLWSSIFQSWSTTKLDGSQYRRALRILGHKALKKSHAHPIADVLQALVRYTDLPEFDELIGAADTVAVDLWKSIDGQDIPEECDDWLIKAWNHPAGVLIQFWMDSLAYWNSRGNLRLAHQEKYLMRFLEVVRDDSAAGRLGRCVLARHLSRLLAIDEAWTKDNLLPLFYDFTECSNREDYLAVWDGLLSETINTSVAQIMKIPFLDAVRRMAKESAGSARRKSFVECYTFMLSFFAGDPVGTWIPELLKWADDGERRRFIWSVHERLENMNESQQVDIWTRWLESYWKNRVKGLPDGLRPREIWHMLRWLPVLKSVFPEAVDIAIRMSAEDMRPETGRNMVFTLNQSDLPTVYPESVAKLLIYLGKCDKYSEEYRWYEGKELVDRLLQDDLPDDLETGLKKLVAKKGLQ